MKECVLSRHASGPRGPRPELPKLPCSFLQKEKLAMRGRVSSGVLTLNGSWSGCSKMLPLNIQNPSLFPKRGFGKVRVRKTYLT